jgi:hypothetical protein
LGVMRLAASAVDRGDLRRLHLPRGLDPDPEPDPAPKAGRLIAQERDLIACYEGRQSSAGAVAAGAVTGVLAGGADGDAGQDQHGVDRAFAR